MTTDNLKLAEVFSELERVLASLQDTAQFSGEAAAAAAGTPMAGVFDLMGIGLGRASELVQDVQRLSRA